MNSSPELGGMNKEEEPKRPQEEGSGHGDAEKDQFDGHLKTIQLCFAPGKPVVEEREWETTTYLLCVCGNPQK